MVRAVRPGRTCRRGFRRLRSVPSVNRAKSRPLAGVSPDLVCVDAEPVRKDGSVRYLLSPNCKFTLKINFCNVCESRILANLPYLFDSTGNIVAVRSSWWCHHDHRRTISTADSEGTRPVRCLYARHQSRSWAISRHCRSIAAGSASITANSR